MEKLPDMWRTELIHPLFVHFPIALLLIATLLVLFRRLHMFPKWNNKLSFSILLLLIPGTILAWIAVYTGNLADNIVGREVCDPTVLEDHERFAYLTSFLFTAVTLIEIALQIWHKGFSVPATRLRKFLAGLSVVLVLGGAGSISYVGHLGAKLVYQQAAGVHQPSKDCGEFE